LKTQKYFLRVPSNVSAKVSLLGPDAAIGCIKQYSKAEIAAGKLRHLSILSEDDLVADTRIIPPANSGRWSKRNREGYLEIHRDRPKETVYHELPNWGDWSNGSHSHPFQRYPRTKHAGKETSLLVHRLSVTESHITVKVTVDFAFDERGAHFNLDLLECCNLVLENVGHPEVLSITATDEEHLRSHRLDWQLLPPGSVEQDAARIASTYGRRASVVETRIVARMKHLAGLKPVNWVYGTDGFRRYFGAMFDDNLVVFENIELGNALYILYENWAEASRRSRVELLRGSGGRFDRIVHSGRWQERLMRLLVAELRRRRGNK
jgi:hypothetical protein